MFFDLFHETKQIIFRFLSAMQTFIETTETNKPACCGSRSESGSESVSGFTVSTCFWASRIPDPDQIVRGMDPDPDPALDPDPAVIMQKNKKTLIPTSVADP